MSKHLKELLHLAEKNELTVLERPGNLVMIIGGKRIVHWWPTSKRVTAYAEGDKKGVKYATPKKVIEMAMGNDV